MPDTTMRLTASLPAGRALAEAAEQWPAGTPVRHTSGRTGTVSLDNPDHVPGWVTAPGPTAWCVCAPHDTAVLVCVKWRTNIGIPLVAWAAPESLTNTSGSRRNNQEEAAC